MYVCLWKFFILIEEKFESTFLFVVPIAPWDVKVYDKNMFVLLVNSSSAYASQ